MNYYLILGIAWITFVLGLTYGLVGTMSGPSEPYPWWMVPEIAALLITLFVCGYFAGNWRSRD